MLLLSLVYSDALPALCSSLFVAAPRVSRAFADAVLRRLPVARSQALRAGVVVVRSPTSWALAVARVPHLLPVRYYPLV